MEQLLQAVSYTHLDVYKRQGLSTVATDTRTGTEYLDKTKTGMQVFGEDQSYIFMPILQDKLVGYTVKLYQTLLSKGYSVDDIAVLSCYNVGDYGTVDVYKRQDIRCVSIYLIRKVCIVATLLLLIQFS